MVCPEGFAAHELGRIVFNIVNWHNEVSENVLLRDLFFRDIHLWVFVVMIVSK